MTIIAGLFSYDGRSLDENLCHSIRAALSRHPADTPIEFRSARCYLAKVDIGAYGERAFERRGQTSAAVLAGDPHLTARNGRTRTADLSRLHDAVLDSDFRPLRTAHGSFCSAHYLDSLATLTLVVDKLALRPLYYWHDPGLIAFASALRILEAVTELRKSLDIKGLCEQLSFGYPLGDRTAYQEIRCLCAGQVVTFSHGGERRSHYWRWDSLRKVSLDPAEAPSLVKDAIKRAIARRLKPWERSVAAFLSGGLDSRLVATILKGSVDHLHTFTFADEGLLDFVLAHQYAERLGSQHHACPFVEAHTHPSAAYGKLLASSPPGSGACVDRPQIVWSGDGGSVCIGCVYLGSSIVDLFRYGLEAQAVEEFLRLNRRSLGARRVLGRLFGQVPSDFAARAMKSEIESLDCNNPAMKAYVFLLLNDQRRHLAGHFELIDVHRTELHLPLLDSEIIELMLGLPLEYGLQHRFYYDMLQHFPTIVHAVPWQAYPGHLPCPLPAPRGSVDQWEFSKKNLEHKSKQLAVASKSILRDRGIPKPLLDRRWIYFASLTARLGMPDYAYLLEGAATVYQHWKVCGMSTR